MITAADLTAFFLTIRLALVSTLILFLIGTPVAWWLARTRWSMKFIADAVIALPLVLPPTVLGFYLLLLLGANGPLSALTSGTLAFSFTGLVLGSVIYSMPFVIQPLQDAFRAVGNRPHEVAATLGATPLDRFISITLPMARPGFLTAGVLGFAHTLGEFGVVLMIGGNIPGETRVLSIAIYDHVESLNYASAHWLAGALLVLSFIMLAAVYAVNRQFRVMKL
ncbi:MAG: molybdate ABC transporter permease subunit [Gammaproteobacteria bacterium]|nr:molybdate ABC transporter permease subunit [Gammaproteobacteria bacterium]